MERPSHLSLDSQARCLPCRLPYAGLAISLQCAAVLLFIYGIANHTTIRNIIPDIKVPPIQEPEIAERVKPPEPQIAKKVPIEKPIQPIFTMENPRGEKTDTFRRPVSNDPPPTGGVDRALASIPATHTAPPYPPVARRLGAEGKVTLRLTVSAGGKVTAADIVTSSGREDLDQAASQWIVAHWTYKPALNDGVPTVGQTLATIVFSLVNER
jgi:periplasmic protein TonB